MKLNTIILAAGKGTRMRSSMPKVLHKVGHLTILEHIVNATAEINSHQTSIVYGHGKDLVKNALAHKKNLNWVLQKKQQGTGHAVKMCLNSQSACDVCLVLVGDIPLISSATLNRLVAAAQQNKLCILSALMPDPSGYGRIVKDEHGNVTAIVEEKDATELVKQIKEINTGVLAIPGAKLDSWIKQIDNNNAQGEYYLTDIVKIARAEQIAVEAIIVNDNFEVYGINNKLQLATVEREYQRRKIEQLMLAGLTVKDAQRIDIRGNLSFKQDVVVDVNTVFNGDVKLGENTIIEPNCIITASSIGDNCHIKANTVIEHSIVGNNCTIGPFARLRPDSNCQEGAKIGNFVEIKNSQLARNSKVNHLSYIGDAKLGENVNIGAGTITCNYDGVKKSTTTIESDAFVGSNSSLIAPLRIGKGATIGAGSVISKDAPANQLTVSRAKQVTITNWQKPSKE